MYLPKLCLFWPFLSLFLETRSAPLAYVHQSKPPPERNIGDAVKQPPETHYVIENRHLHAHMYMAENASYSFSVQSREEAE